MMERLFCDLHIHSCLSPCGDALMTPNNIAGMAFIKGLDVIAVCDHNSARNLPAVKAAADLMNVLLLPGMELTTREEAHMLCYFRTVQACMAFGEAIYAHLAPTPNNERFFGRQQVMNERDEEIDVEERLLIGALDLPFEACAARIREAGLRVLRLVGLEDFADYYPNQLSGGMRKRAGLARAIIAEPRVLLCDEPTSGLDFDSMAQVAGLIKRLSEQGKIIFIVTHDFEFVCRTCSRVLHFDEGEMPDDVPVTMDALPKLRELFSVKVNVSAGDREGGLGRSDGKER